MGVIGFSFSKFDCERAQKTSGGQIQINYGIAVKDVKKTALNVGGSKTDVLKVDFSFDVMYGNGLGKIGIVGDVIYTDTAEIVEETIKTWQADKKLTEIVNEQVLSFVYNKSVVKALDLADSLNLPSPMPLPKISFGGKDKKQ
ncbi:MAG: hypothetical protein ACOCUT_03815 [bacterium]